ncbi:flavin reductase family protein [Alcaligenes sp. SDU_A2]|uniref:flavin reductase family protein n=1 Tax=Alcaligenes sp. SDU_A2 TaxID=3136634 RepID=UPI002C588394|nr:flavin reductase family protein [Alcaligenes sp.]HRL27095.1 flavin reductase family protein [Alcaligenes sp.]
MTAVSSTFDTDFFRSALGRFATGVTVVTGPDREHPGLAVGLTVSSFNSVSLSPPLVLWSLAKQSRSLPHFLHGSGYVIHVLGASQLALAKRFAWGEQAERFREHPLRTSPNGLPMLADPGCSAWFECRPYACHEAGDHIIFIGEVTHCERNAHQPLIYHAGDFDLTPSQD